MTQHSNSNNPHSMQS